MNPFAKTIVLKKDIPKIAELVELHNKLVKTESRYEKYRLLISNIKVSDKAKETMSVYSSEYIYERLKKNHKKSLPVTLAQAYEIYSEMLVKELKDYTVDDGEKLLSMIDNGDVKFDSRYNEGAKFEATNFYNYIVEKYNNNKNSNYRRRRKPKAELFGKDSYTREQLLLLFGLLYEGIEDRILLNKAIENRICACAWLYMFLHYCTFWRKKSLFTIPSPDLKVIGFDDGESFIEWLKNPESVFTQEMGIKICASTKLVIDSVNKKATKNNQSLVFEVGRLMSRAAGLLLALCEAQRQIKEKEQAETDVPKKTFGVTSVELQT